MKIALRWLGRLVTAALLALFGIVVLVPAVTGSTTLTVLSGSMEPTFKPGALLIVQPVKAEEIQVGSILTYRPASDEDILITHRVVSQQVTDAGTSWVTRGDANGADDAPIVYEQVRGKVLFAVPYLGYVRQFLTSGGPWLMIGVALVMVLALLWPLLRRGAKNDDAGEAGGSPEAGPAAKNTQATPPSGRRPEPVTATLRGASS